MKAPAEPRTPRRARRIAESRCGDVGVGKAVVDVVGEVVFVGVVIIGGLGGEEVKNEVGRAIITTPSKEIKEAY